jgi:3-isopropylmalate dehydrogenase
MDAQIVLLPGDGIGPEVTSVARQALEWTADLFGHRFTFAEHPIGGVAIETLGSPLPQATLNACRSADGVLLGAVGGPQWDSPDAATRPEDGLLGLRKELGLYANLRPVRVVPELVNASPLRPELLQDVDLLIVRELTGGLYFGQPRGRETRGDEVRAVDTLEYTSSEIRRLVELAFKLAAARRARVTSVDKANVLETSRLWRTVVEEVAERNPQVDHEHMLVDAAAMRLMQAPAGFDVLVTENMFGDILSDEASVLAGSLGLLPSASLGDGGVGVFEPVHGSAPDIAGQGIANPVGALLSAAMLLRHSLHLTEEAAQLEDAIDHVLGEGIRTPDLGGSARSAEFGEAVGAALATRRSTAAGASAC